MPLSTFKDHPRLWLSLLLAAAQGLALFRLHVAIEGQVWPAADFQWLFSLYAVTIFVPVTVHLLCNHLRDQWLWLAVAALTTAWFGFGWHFGANVAVPARISSVDGAAVRVFGLSLIVLWLLCMPFLRCRLEGGRWRCSYGQLFAAAWQNKLTLAQAALFTVIFWLLLGLWAVLFDTLGNSFFEDLFSDPAFAYPFTAIAFGLSIHLVGSVERLVSVAREQILELLKWLAPVAGVILALFVPALLLKLPDLVFEGERAIGAAWLLWLLAVAVTLLNAGYQNGLAEKPYPRWLSLALRCVVPLMPLVALVAGYALLVRIGEYGVTVSRVHGLIVAGAAILYAFGYAVAALRRGAWMRGIERVNVGVALVLIAATFLTLTPLFSPYRLAAASQSAHALSDTGKQRDSAFQYLRFDAGAYGQRELARLAKLEGGEAEQQIAAIARRFQALDQRYGVNLAEEADLWAALPVYPKHRLIEPALQGTIRRGLGGSAWVTTDDAARVRSAVLFLDLGGDPSEECVVFSENSVAVYEKRGAGWHRSGDGLLLDATNLRQDLESGSYAAVAPPLQDLRIGNSVIPIGRSQWPMN